MKNLLSFIAILIFGCTQLIAQQQFTINGETIILRVELEGDLDFLTYKSNDSHRFFVKDKNETIFELLNTKQTDNSYLKEYKTILNKLTEGSYMSTKEVGFGHYSLKKFIRAYNSSGTRRYTYTGEKVYMQSRIGLFGGVTNHPFKENIKNAKVPALAIELEVFAKNPKPKQSGYFSISHAFENSDMPYTSTQLGLGYRYRFISKTRFSIYGDLRFATYTFSKETFEAYNNEIVNEAIFHIPFSFGIGSEIKVSNSSFITLTYNELFALFMNNSNNFPVNIALGYKFNL